MTEKEMWNAYIIENPNYQNEIYEAWCYGSDTPDLLADLTLKGIKTATASAYPFYEYEKCDLPKPGLHNLIMNSKNEGVCIIKTTKVSVIPFSQVDAKQAYREGEGDRSLTYWRDVHAIAFTKELEEIDYKFNEDMLVVCEEFELVYPQYIV